MLWRCPTLPHPPRCSTISAHRLSNRVRKGQPGVTLRLSPPTHPTQHHWCCARHCTANTKPHTPPPTAAAHTNPHKAHAFLFSSFLSCCQHTHMFPTPCALSHTILWHTTTTMGCVCVGHISIGHLTTPYDASNSDLSTPSSTGNLNRNLISQQASRLDAFSGYPSRT